MLNIRPATIAELPQIVAMSDAIQAYERDLAGYPLLEPAKTSVAYLDRMMERHAAGGLTLVAELDGNLAGYISGHTEEEDDIFVDPAFRRFARVSDIYVAELARRQGVAAALLDEFSSEMKRRGHRYLRIATKAQNVVALESYEQLGFSRYEVELFKAL